MDNATLRPPQTATAELWLPRLLAALKTSAADKEHLAEVLFAYPWPALARQGRDLAQDITDTDDNGPFTVLEIEYEDRDVPREEWLDAVDEVAWFWGLHLVQWAERWAIASRPIDPENEQLFPPYERQMADARARILAAASEWNLLEQQALAAHGQKLATAISAQIAVGRMVRQEVHDWIVGHDGILETLRERCREHAGDVFASLYVRDLPTEAETFGGLS